MKKNTNQQGNRIVIGWKKFKKNALEIIQNFSKNNDAPKLFVVKTPKQKAGLNQNIRTNGFVLNDYFTPVVLVLLCLNCLIFFLGSIMPGGILEGQQISLKTRLELSFALWPLRSPFFHIWQYLTYMFLHGSLSHLMLNMFGLWMFGTQIERAWGAKKMSIYYLLCGIGAGVLHTLVYLFFDNGTMGGEAVGASGAIMGIIIAFGFMYPEVRIYFMFFLPIKAKYAILIFAAIDLYLGLLGNDNVAHFAHLGGALMGYLLIKSKYFGNYKLNYFSNKSKNNLIHTTEQFQNNINEHQIADNQHSNTNIRPNNITVNYNYTSNSQDERLNYLLDKISSGGYNSLTDEEKNYLNSISENL